MKLHKYGLFATPKNIEELKQLLEGYKTKGIACHCFTWNYLAHLQEQGELNVSIQEQADAEHLKPLNKSEVRELENLLALSSERYLTHEELTRLELLEDRAYSQVQ
jgi:hypothetical protein